jgi:hypothetical protein
MTQMNEAWELKKKLSDSLASLMLPEFFSAKAKASS